MALHTFHVSKKDAIESKLKKMQIDYVFRQVNEEKINVFFGAEPCINIIRSIGNKPLSDYSCEEDFILGIMLGYDRLKQCERYIDIKRKKEQLNKKRTVKQSNRLQPVCEFEYVS